MAATRQTQDSPYPQALVVQPKSGKHKQSILMLHGRGSTASAFAPPLVELLQNNNFPNARFIFPTASRRRVQEAPMGVMSNQWFDIWSVARPDERVELQYDGLRETTEYIHSLLRAEVAEVGAENVVLWGLSQGCAAGLMSLLLWEGNQLGGYIGMCGWLPLRKLMEDELHAKADSIEDEVGLNGGESKSSAGDDARDQGHSTLSTLSTFLRRQLDLPSAATPGHKLHTPVFLGHGTLDEKVPLHLAQEATRVLHLINIDVAYKEYADLGHWYSVDMLDDIMAFIEQQNGWHVKELATSRPA